MGEEFTWSNDTGIQHTRSRMDRALGNTNWASRWPQIRPRLIMGTTSDHAGLLIQLAKLERGSAPFKFFNSWQLSPSSRSFRSLVMSCVRTALVSVLVEGSPTRIIKLRRGLRQGDLLSPLLFTIVINYLSKLVEQAVRGQRIELYTSGGIVVESHLAFECPYSFAEHHEDCCRVSVS